MGILDGVTVLDLSSGIAGPITGMLLADHGARVVKIEPPGGDRFRHLSGYQVWNRGKQSAVLDVKRADDHARLLSLAKGADVLLESFAAGVTQRLGIDFPTLRALNDRLVHCSITAYGRDTPDAGRPGYDALVAARTGLHWEQRGWPGTNVDRLAGRPPHLADLEVPDGCIDGAPRDGPLFPYSAWPSLGAAFCATTAISAALLARETTSKGQWVETSLLQGALAATAMTWQRVEDPDAPGLWSWMFDARGPKGFFRCADGRWVQNWVQRPNFVLAAAEGATLRVPEGFAASRHDPDRLGTGEGDLPVLHHYTPLMAEAFARFPAHEWVEVARRGNVALQAVRSPEEALEDPSFLADGCVIELDDPELGCVRQVGAVYSFERCPATIGAGPPRLGEHTERVKAEADRLATAPPTRASTDGRPLDAPLDGVTVLDLGFAIAGPFGAQLLADLGADVIKVNSFTDTWWHENHLAYSCNRGKRSIAVNLKDPRGLAVLHRLVSRADVVHHNMRPQAAARLGVDYESIRGVNPRIVYCHTRGFERVGPRVDSPGNDQTGAALTGVEWEDGAVGAGGRPFWSLTSFGDTGNGFLSAIAVIQALYHRARTGEGQLVDTSIVNAGLLNTSYAWTTTDGRSAPRPRLDRMQLGIGALHRLYPTADGWLCVAVLTEPEWLRLAGALGDLADDPRFVTADARATNDAALAAELEAIFLTRSAAEWFDALDAANVPVEVSSPTYAMQVFDDPEMLRRQWVVSYEQPRVGRMEQFGLLFDLSDTPGRIAGPPLVVGDHTREILLEHGYGDDEVQRLVDEKVVVDAAGTLAQKEVRSA